MAEEEKNESEEQPEAEETPAETDETPAEEALAKDAAVEAPAEEAPAEKAPAEEPVAEEPKPEESEPDAPHPQAVENPDTPGSEAEDVSGSDSEEVSGSNSEDVSGSDSEDEVALAADAATEAPSDPPSKPVAPGADLEPIDLEPQAPLSAEEKARLEAEEEERASREAKLDGDGEEDATASRVPAQMKTGAHYTATGKRKRSIARVILTPGDGKIEINQRTLEEYFPRPLHQTMARQPLASAGYEDNVDVRIRVHGGGISGQAGAVRHGIARALTEVDPELRGDLKRRGFLTRDARVKERRKAGFKKARKKPQFSKR